MYVLIYYYDNNNNNNNKRNIIICTKEQKVGGWNKKMGKKVAWVVGVGLVGARVARL
jgi:hypothetical protein